MGEESNKKRKASLVLDWDKLLDRQDDDPQEIVVTNISSDMTQSAMGNGESNHQNYESLSDVELDGLIARKKGTYQSMAPKLPDKGKKLSDRITMLEQEKERRSKNHPKLKDDNGSEMSTHFETSSVMSTSAGVKQVPPSSVPRSQFSSLFCQKVEENQANRKYGASDYQSNVLGRCDVRKTRLNSQVSLEERCRSGLTSRKTAFQSPTCLSGGTEKENASNGDTYPSHSSLILIKDPSGCSSRSLHRKARSLSPLRSGDYYGEPRQSEEDIQAIDDKVPSIETTPSVSASSSRSSSSGRNSKKWIFLKDLLYRSKSEGRGNTKDKFWSSLSFSHSGREKKRAVSPSLTPSSSRDDKEKVRNRKSQAAKKSASVGGKPANGVSKRRVALSAHELHYTANRAQAEEMKKKTYLP